MKYIFLIKRDASSRSLVVLSSIPLCSLTRKGEGGRVREGREGDSEREGERERWSEGGRERQGWREEGREWIDWSSDAHYFPPHALSLFFGTHDRNGSMVIMFHW